MKEAKNRVCGSVSAPALRFNATNPAFEPANWPDICGIASGTGISADGCCFDGAAVPGGLSDGGGHLFEKNEADPDGSCSE